MAKKKKSQTDLLAGGLLSLVGFGIIVLALILFNATGDPQALIYLGIFSFAAFAISFYIFKSENPFSLGEKLKGNTMINLFGKVADASLINQQLSTKNCPSCQKPVTWRNARFCSACGTDLSLQCSQCNIPLRIGDSFCYKCGQSVAKSTPPILSRSSIPATLIASRRCPSCNAVTTTQDAFCGSCGKPFITATDQTMQT